jgi:D-glycero-D-manno-heptose 1,7-bisphosphate phosphatase
MLRQAVFLVGGLGTRLKDRTKSTPKPLLEVGGRPFIDYLLDEAARHGFTDIVLLAGHLGDQVESLYHGRDWRGARIRVLREPELLGTGGALRFALPELAPAFLMSNGDSFFDINLRVLTESIAPGGAVMALRAAANDTRYGRVKFANGRVRSFHASDEGLDGPINGGIYCLSRDVVAAMPEGKHSLEADTFPALAASGNIQGRLFEGYFIDIGVPDDFARAQTEMPRRVRRPAVFFDRDGVLNEDTGYVYRKEDFRWLDGAKEAIRLCNDRGFFAFVVTNQAGVARGLYDEAAIDALHRWIDEELAAVGAHIDAYEFCPHHPDGVIERYRTACRRRKPEPGMLLDLMKAWPIDKRRSFLMGDKQSDINAARTANIRAFSFASGNLRNQITAELNQTMPVED